MSVASQTIERHPGLREASTTLTSRMMTRLLLCLFLSCTSLLITPPDDRGQAEAAGAPVCRRVHIRSSVDGQRQPAWFFVPNQSRCYKLHNDPVPLLVALHSWGGGYGNSPWKKYRRECAKFGFVMIRPHYRGPNVRPEACASDLAVQDVLDAVEYAQNNARVDPRRVYLVGCSGGGHMALTLAHLYPQTWAAVSVWGAQTDLFALYRQSRRIVPRYVRNLKEVCGGPPGTEDADREYRKRSPLFHLDTARELPIDINAGIHDGYEGPVTIDHSLRAFNALARANGHADDLLSGEQIQYLVKEQKVPSSLTDTWERDIRRRTPILFRRSAGPVRLTIFDGEHEIDYYAAVRWLAQQPPRSSESTEPPAVTRSPGESAGES